MVFTPVPTLALDMQLWHIGLVLVIGILLFGKRLPDIGKNVGKTIVEFKKGLNNASEEINKAAKEPEEPQQRPAIQAKSSTNARSVKQIASTSEEP
jgi:sec-independent protein translocase protein TatA